ncbi:MAG: hypothetical protein E7393_06640 [Ruminococcaceae bacterium]|nr:hypothetical protein [Oscillospiraceae bacterium]
MKKRVLFLLFGMLLAMPFSASALESKGYIFQLPKNAPALYSFTTYSSLPADAMALGSGFFYTNDEAFIEKNKGQLASFPNYMVTLFENSPTLDSPNDTKYSHQWYLQAIHASAPRVKGVFGKGVTVAVIDSGLTTNHPDLNQGNILSGINCAFEPMYNQANELVGFDVPPNPNDVTDTNGHGTMVTGLIAAQTNNALDIAGVASHAKILPIKVQSTDNGVYLNSILYAMDTAISYGCDVINMSLGTPLDPADINQKSAIDALQGLVDNALEENITIVAAVGNDGGTDPDKATTPTVVNYPAGCDGVIGVAGVTRNNNGDYTAALQSSRNYSVLIAAPGGGTAIDGSYTGICGLSNNGGVNVQYGTSFASPIVAGTVALIKDIWPDATVAEITSLVTSTATDLDNSTANEEDIVYGHGLLNLQSILEELSDKIPLYALSNGCTRDVSGNITSSYLYIHNNTQENLIPKFLFVVNKADRDAMTWTALTFTSFAPGITQYFPTEVDFSKGDELYLWADGLRPLAKKHILN